MFFIFNWGFFIVVFDVDYIVGLVSVEVVGVFYFYCFIVSDIIWKFMGFLEVYYYLEMFDRLIKVYI